MNFYDIFQFLVFLKVDYSGSDISAVISDSSLDSEHAPSDGIIFPNGLFSPDNATLQSRGGSAVYADYDIWQQVISISNNEIVSLRSNIPHSESLLCTIISGQGESIEDLIDQLDSNIIQVSNFYNISDFHGQFLWVIHFI